MRFAVTDGERAAGELDPAKVTSPSVTHSLGSGHPSTTPPPPPPTDGP